jgi:hypothetical protein
MCSLIGWVDSPEYNTFSVILQDLIEPTILVLCYGQHALLKGDPGDPSDHPWVGTGARVAGAPTII